MRSSTNTTFQLYLAGSTLSRQIFIRARPLETSKGLKFKNRTRSPSRTRSNIKLPNILNLPHKLHIFGHFLAMVSSKAVHMASVSDLPHSLSKSSQSPTRDGREFRLHWYNVNSLTIKLEGNSDILTTKILVAKSFTRGAFRTWLTNLIRELID